MKSRRFYRTCQVIFSFAVGNFEIRNGKCICTVIFCCLIPRDEKNIGLQFLEINPDVTESALVNDTDQSTILKTHNINLKKGNVCFLPGFLFYFVWEKGVPCSSSV